MNIAIVHHHFRPGGVTKVVLAGAEALKRYMPEVGEILLVCGELPELDEEGLFHGFPVLHLPQAAYRPDVPPGAAAEAGSIAELLDRHVPDHLLWVHNYQLGKNGPFTAGVVEYALRHPDRSVVLQIHDFPECGRHGNLAELYSGADGKGGGGPLYPILPNVLYMVINERDRRLLAASGIPESHVVLMDNPVPVSRGGGPDREAVRALFAGGLEGTAGSVDPELPLFIYPVRTIRRKNVLEAALLGALHEGGANLLVTLPGTSAQEREYSRLVRALFEEGSVRGSFGAGALLDDNPVDFETLARSCDLVVSSSVQEGFGYFFVDALRWGLPLFARRLDILDGIEPLFSGYPHHLYDRLLVPVDAAGRKELAARYRERLLALSPFLSEEERGAPAAVLEAMMREELVDFSFLDPPRQAELLRSLSAGSLLDDIRAANAPLTDKLKELCGQRPEPPIEEIERFFGPESFARKARGYIAQLKTNMRLENDPVHRSLLKQFATPEYLRLIYEMEF